MEEGSEVQIEVTEADVEVVEEEEVEDVKDTVNCQSTLCDHANKDTVNCKSTLCDHENAEENEEEPNTVSQNLQKSSIFKEIV